ncbi:MAG: hypothetical protein ACD_79C00494G0008, partial [uncultured bacterium]
MSKARVAQLVEHSHGKRKVGGSIPLVGSRLVVEFKIGEESMSKEKFER